MVNITDLMKIDSFTINTVSLNATKVGYLAGTANSAPNFNAISSKCVITDLNKDINGLSSLSATTLTVSGTATSSSITQSTINIDSSAVGTGFTLDNARLANSISGTAIVTANAPTNVQNKLCSTHTLIKYMTDQVSIAISGLERNRHAIVGTKSGFYGSRISSSSITYTFRSLIVGKSDKSVTKRIKGIGSQLISGQVSTGTVGSIGGISALINNNNWYYVWYLWNPGTQQGGFYGVYNTLSFPTLSGYTYGALVSCFRVDHNNSIVNFLQQNNRYTYQQLDYTSAYGSGFAWLPSQANGGFDAITVDYHLPDPNIVEEIYITTPDFPPAWASVPYNKVYTEKCGEESEEYCRSATSATTFGGFLPVTTYRANSHKIVNGADMYPYDFAIFPATPSGGGSCVIGGFKLRI
jgi:hypothetical protein